MAPARSHEVHVALRAAAAGAQRYRSYPNVLGIAAGTKFRRGRPTDELCVQFFVARKSETRGGVRRPLPAFVYGRTSEGRVDRTRRFSTDVIEVGAVEFACGGGAGLDAVGERGTITLLFRNRAETASRAYYLITCAHVVGDLDDSPPSNRDLRSEACAAAAPFAVVVKNSVRKRRALDYDVALAAITDAARAELGEIRLRQLDGRISERELVLDGFAPAGEIGPDLAVDCQLGESGHASGRVRSFAGAVRATLGGRTLTVRNVHLMDVAVAPGDSGGIVYAEARAVGIVFARSPGGWGWFQPLGSAVAALAAIEPTFALRCFAADDSTEERR